MAELVYSVTEAAALGLSRRTMYEIINREQQAGGQKKAALDADNIQDGKAEQV